MDIFRRVGLAGPPTYSRAKKRRRGRQIWPGALDERGPFGSTCCLTVSRDQRRRLVAFASCILLGDWRATHTERYPPPPPPSTGSQKLHKKRGERERARKRMESRRKCLELPLEDHEPWLVAGRTYLLSRELPAPAFTICHRALCLFVKKGRRRKEQSVYGFGSRGYE